MRKFINIVEAHNEPPHGAGDPVTAETAPDILYHGTGPVAAAGILQDSEINANHPVDDDDLGAVVCVTSDHEMGQNFATGFARIQSPYDVGIIFVLDGKAIADEFHTIPYHAETAGAFEYEFRVLGDIPLSMVKDIRIVGDRDLLDEETFIEEMWIDSARHYFLNFSDFSRAIEALKKAAT